MKHIQLWKIQNDTTGKTAVPVSSRESTDTEALLEEILVRSPSLLGDRLRLVGRQVQTEGGPLDLLGVDEDGRLVVFELKRGTLTRDAVAQVLDYASDLADSDPERVTRLIQDYSGRLGIERLEDFEDWYSENYPNSTGLLSAPPKMVLVGLGADDRARKMVNFLADTGVEIELLTFHAFENDGTVFLARQIDRTSPVRQPRPAAVSQTKEGNLQVLHDSAKRLGVFDLLETVAGVVAKALSASYQWPGKTAYAFSLSERTPEGNPTLRVYVGLYLNQKQTGSLTLTVFNRAVQCAQGDAEAFLARLPNVARVEAKYGNLEIQVNQTTWNQIAGELQPLLTAIETGWKAKANAVQGSGEVVG